MLGRLSRRLLDAFIISVITILLIEVGFRFVPSRVLYPYAIFNNWHADFKYMPDSKAGYLLPPNQKIYLKNAAHEIGPICTNSLGFRGKEWSGDKNFKIAVLGDSFAAGLQVSDGDVASSILEKLLNKRVLNLGSMAANTVSELFAYKKFLKDLKPNIVILFYFVHDTGENHYELRKLGGDVDQTSAYLLNGKLYIVPAFDSSFVRNYSKESNAIRSMRKIIFYIKKNSLIYDVADKLLCGYRSKKKWTRDIPLSMRIFQRPATGLWEEAWIITEQVLIELNEDVKKNGGTLIVVPITSNMYSLDDIHFFWEKTFGPIPHDFDFNYPLEKITEISNRNGIRVINCEKYFFDYLDKFELKNPRFSYWCDLHWNPIGHFIIANAVAEYLIKQNLVPMETVRRAKMSRKVIQNLNLSPVEILGKKAYAQIYCSGDRRIYAGFSNIKKILEKGDNL